MVHINANWYVFGKYVRICKYVRVYKLVHTWYKYVRIRCELVHT